MLTGTSPLLPLHRLVIQTRLRALAGNAQRGVAAVVESQQHGELCGGLLQAATQWDDVAWLRGVTLPAIIARLGHVASGDDRSLAVAID